jgi:general secretion pathway protein K
MSGARPRQRGFALLIVLWTLVFVTFLLTQIMASGRGAVNLAGNLRVAAAQRAAADGAINAVIFQLLATGPAQWKPGGPAQVVRVGGQAVRVRVRGLAGMVNPNLASPALLAGLLQALAVPPAQAQTLAGAIIAWRGPPASPAAGAATLAAYAHAGMAQAPAARPFAALGELNDVLGMTAPIYARLAPELSLYQQGDPDPKAADKVVARALLLASAAAAPGGGYASAPVADITACLDTGLCRHAVVSLEGGEAFQPFRILAMEDAH